MEGVNGEVLIEVWAWLPVELLLLMFLLRVKLWKLW